MALAVKAQEWRKELMLLGAITIGGILFASYVRRWRAAPPYNINVNSILKPTKHADLSIPRHIIEFKSQNNGEWNRSLNERMLISKVDSILKRCREHPPVFAEPIERTEVETLIRYLVAIVEWNFEYLDGQLSPEALTSMGDLYLCAYNMDLKLSFDGRKYPWWRELFGLPPPFDSLKGTIYYEKALNLTPNDAVINKKFGEFLFTVGNTRKAVICLEKAAKNGYPSAWAELGICYNKLGEKQKAIESFEQYCHVYPNDFEVRKILDLLRYQAVSTIRNPTRHTLSVN
jgi:tetratricopeptide (TPR) repeat protein